MRSRSVLRALSCLFSMPQTLHLKHGSAWFLASWLVQLPRLGQSVEKLQLSNHQRRSGVLKRLATLQISREGRQTTNSQQTMPQATNAEASGLCRADQTPLWPFGRGFVLQNSAQKLIWFAYHVFEMLNQFKFNSSQWGKRATHVRVV